MAAHRQTLNAMAEPVLATPAEVGSTLEGLRAILLADRGLRVLRATELVVAHGAGADADPGCVAGDPGVREALAAALRRGAAAGELRPDADLDAFLDALLAVYVWHYRGAAASEKGSLDRMMGQQIGLLLESVAA
jgi:hypothetical protein